MAPLSARRWQIAALMAAVLPQLDRLPYWLVAAVVLAGLWRLPSVERRVGAPGALVRGLLLIAGMAGIFVSHHTFIGPEGGVSFLLLCALMKMLESRNQRDMFVSAVLDFFILATAFLFSQTLALTLYVGAAFIIIVAALLAQQQRDGVGVRRTLQRATMVVLQALPLMLILFVFFPRLPPLWTFNLSQGTGRTGMSDSMSPGDISSLSESAAVAFRVEFQNGTPPSRLLYWRGLVLSHFDGKRWVQSEGVQENIAADWHSSPPSWVTAGTQDGALHYRIILEPTDQPWLFSLALPYSPTAKTGFTRDYRLVYRDPVFSRLTYDVVSLPQGRADVARLPVWLLRQNLQLPASGNPQTRLMARRWLAGSGSPEKYVRDVLDWFRAERFFYTLEPPALGDDRIDDFLFHTRRGFCEHYASSFVFLMRAAGIPARVVIGYQGGEQSPLGDYWMVRQLDAHAWAEVWLPDTGWVSVDPTSVVAPDRIQRGTQALAADRAYWGDSGLGAMHYRNYQLLKGLRNLADYVNYRWHRDVLGYDSDHQDGLMLRLLGDSSLPRRLAVMGGLFLGAGMLLFLWALYGQRRQLHPLDRLYLRHCQRLSRRGLSRAPGEGPLDFAERVATEQPAQAATAREVARLYMALRYRPRTQASRALEKRLRRLA